MGKQLKALNNQDERFQKERLNVIIGRNIRRQRERHNMSRDYFASMLDLTTSHVGLIERGERGATAVTLIKVSTFFDVPINSLYVDPNGQENEDKPDILANRRKINTLTSLLEGPALDHAIMIIEGLVALSKK